jgi:predicted MFS family arabinose efflux permease
MDKPIDPQRSLLRIFMAETTKTIHQQRLVPTVITVTFARVMINGVRRFPYAILTIMADSLHVERSTLEAALSLEWLLGILSPLAGNAIDQFGRKRMMLFSLGSLVVFMMVAAVAQVAGIVLLGLVASGLSKIVYDPAMEAYVSDHTPYERRGTVIGITELAWSGSLFVFGPLAAYLIVQASLGAIFGALAGGSAFAFILLWRIVPADHSTEHHQGSQLRISDMFRLLTIPSVMALLATAALADIAGEAISIVYEEWLRNSFSLTTGIIGSVALIFSIAEVTGEGIVIGLADRVGKRRLALAAFTATGFVYLLLAVAAVGPIQAVALLFLMYLCFEVSIVVLIAMATEALPQARGLMMTSTVASFSIARAIGTLLGGWMFRAAGMGLNAIVAMILSFIAVGLIWRYVVEQ